LIFPSILCQIRNNVIGTKNNSTSITGFKGVFKK